MTDRDAGARAGPPVRFRAVATDLDGTLLRSDGQVSPRTRRTLARLQALGVLVVLVSARPPRVLRHLARAAGVAGLAVCCNGAMVYDLAAERIDSHAPISPAEAWRLVQALRASLPGVGFAAELGLDFAHDHSYAAANPIAHDRPERPIDAEMLCAGEVTKLIVRHPDYPLAEVLAQVRLAAGSALNATHSGAPFIEVMAAGVSKATALARICRNRQIEADAVIAFGDMPNDLPMLAWAGHAVAVANAHPEVLAAVAEIAPTNDEDGVAHTLDRTFPL